MLRRFRPSVRVDTASDDIFLLKTLFDLWPRQVKPSLASWSRARRVAFSTAGGRAQIGRAPFPRSRDSREAAPLLSPLLPSPSVLASPEAAPCAPQQPPFLSARPLTPHRVGDLGQPCDSQCCSMPSSTRSEKVPFRSGGVSFCRPLSEFRRQEDQEKQSHKDCEK